MQNKIKLNNDIEMPMIGYGVYLFFSGIGMHASQEEIYTEISYNEI